jgi:hypothetical protein
MRPVGSLFILNHPVDELIQRSEGAHGRSQRGAEVGDVLGFRGDGFPLNGSGFLGGFAGRHKLNVGDCCATVLQSGIKKQNNGKTVCVIDF